MKQPHKTIYTCLGLMHLCTLHTTVRINLMQRPLKVSPLAMVKVIWAMNEMATSA